MQISQREFSSPAEALVSHSWPERIVHALSQVCEALGAQGCGWLCDFLSPRLDNLNLGSEALLRFTHIDQKKTLLTYNAEISAKHLSGGEMSAVIACQSDAWTPNLQNWPVTLWSKAVHGAQKSADAPTVCIPLHGPQGTRSIVFIPLKDGALDWYPSALRCVGPLLAAEQELRAIFLPASVSQPIGSLTSEEFESLRWAAKGKTAWESARIQGISERAVIHRLRRAREKLGASSTALAITTAARLGHIEAY